jgi:predicted nuclease with TOPRIM domain
MAAVTITLVPTWVWIPIGVFLLGVTGVSAALVVVGLRAFRRFRAAGRSLTASLEELTRRSAELERRAGALAERVERLQAARARLRASLDRLEVLNWALGDARDLLARLRGVSGK